MVARPRFSGNEWLPPDLDTFYAVINRLTSKLISKDFPCATVLSWCSVWCEVGLMGLVVTDLEQMRLFREAIAATVYGGEEFNSFPKDLLAPSPEVSTILKGVLADVNLHTLPKELCVRNPGLYGGLQIISVHKYDSTDVTKDGRSMRGWKLVRILADDLFLRAIQTFDDDHGFTLGGGKIRVRGGRRHKVQRIFPHPRRSAPLAGPPKKKKDKKKKKKAKVCLLYTSDAADE